ncbi:HPP family protein [Ideonella sp. 4Y16]|uniref:HPP family protein n=1 Tax=Ideonella alba TaxID=2824118 RepID=A0A940YG23_9BURK|nr:HPP family protein [Ideonella alba]MBQ0933518.1 HPP family protein [Ideonella alba]MBQ0946504.1 HPP family protein [Ideonella alba]
MTPPPTTPTLPWWQRLRPPALAIDARERMRVVAGAFLGIALTALLAPCWPPAPGLPWLMAPLGASAVLVFALPASPLAQPWPVLVGNAVSALVGWASASWLPWPALAAAVAVGGAMAAMLALRCLHPPGGAVALLAVLLPAHQASYAVDPVLLDSLVLVLAGWAWNSATGRPYPHAPQAAPAPTRAWDFSDSDLDTALAHYNQIVDLPRDDLRGLLADAEQQAVSRRLRAIRCQDVMTAQPLRARSFTTLDQALRVLAEAQVKALPVVDADEHVVGIVTRADLRGPADPATTTVAQVMSRQVRVASAERPLADLLPLFSHEGHHHLPVIGADRRLVGILTQTDVITALARL